MLKSILLKSIGSFNKFVAPERISNLSKFMYINKLLHEFKIDLVLDVGANIGEYGQSLRDIGYKGQIVSFEPVATVFADLNKSAAADANWRTLNCALGVVNEKRSINVMKSSVFSSFNKPTNQGTSQFSLKNAVVETQEVTVRRLDEVIDELGLQGKLSNCFLKCDTQGFDRNVLEGMGAYLNSVRLLQLELSVIPIYENTVGMLDMIQYLQDRSFAPVALFPVNRTDDWGAIEFDYIAVNRGLGEALRTTSQPIVNDPKRVVG